MSEEQKEYDLGIATIKFNSLGSAVRYFRQSNENLSISSVTQFMGWTHSQLMDIEFGREILTDINTIKQLAEALEIHSSMLLDLIDISQKNFVPEAFGNDQGSFNGTIYKTFDGKFTYKESNGVWVILASNGPGKVLVEDGIKYFVASKMPEIVFKGKIESNEFAEKLFKSFEVNE